MRTEEQCVCYCKICIVVFVLAIFAALATFCTGDAEGSCRMVYYSLVGNHDSIRRA